RGRTPAARAVCAVRASRRTRQGPARRAVRTRPYGKRRARGQGAARHRRAECRRLPHRASARRAVGLPRPSLLERAPAFLRAERLGELVELPLQDPVELVDRELDPVVGDAVLGIVVGADLPCALAGADLGTPGRIELCALLLAFVLVEARA